MFKRKFLAALITFVLSTLCIALMSPPSTMLGDERHLISDLHISGLYVLGGILFYLLPVTFLIEWITYKASFARFALSLNLHILFSFLTVFFILLLFVFAMLVFAIYFITEECLRMLDNKGPHKLSKYMLRPFKRFN